MSRKLNCWEYKNCGREKGGLMVPILGECPVASAMRFDGVNEGQAGGRACWVAAKSSNRLAAAQIGSRSNNKCHNCEFYRRVLHEEADMVQFRYESVVA